MNDRQLTESEMDIARDVIGGLGSDMSRIDTDDVEEAARAIRVYVEKVTSDRVSRWETGFETTNAAQAIAEHKAVLEKRAALQRENSALRTEVDRLLETNRTHMLQREHAEKRIVELEEEIKELRNPAPPPSEGDGPEEKHTS